MRICLVTTSYPRFHEDGNARFVRSIAEAQATLGHEVHVLAPYTPLVRKYDSLADLHWFHYIWPAKWGVMGHAAALESDRHLRASAFLQAPFFGLSLTRAMQQLITQRKIDLIHAHWVVPMGFLSTWMARLTQKPLFISLHGSDMYLARQNPVMGRMAAWAFRCAQGITACSPTLADSAIQLGAPRERVHMIPWGADPAKFQVEGASVELRKQLNATPKDLIIMAAGRLVGKKGFDRLVRAMPEVLASVPNARLVILGEGPERFSLERLIDELALNGKILLPGNVAWTEMPNYLAASDVFVMPSVRDVTGNFDGLPTVILEAMAAGKPVIATHVGGISLAVQENETGILVDEASPEQLSRALIRLLRSDEERTRLGCAGRARIERELNWMNVARRFDSVYRGSGVTN